MKKRYTYLTLIVLTLLWSYQNCGQIDFGGGGRFNREPTANPDPNNGLDQENNDDNTDDDGDGNNNTGNDDDDEPGDDCLIEDPDCVPPPRVDSPGVVTILLAMGDMDNLLAPMVDQYAAQRIAEDMVRYASPKENPKLLLVLDRNNRGESPADIKALSERFLFRYKPTLIDEPLDGLKDLDVVDFDLVWLVNPGYPMGSKTSFETLMKFSGGVVISGDDMTRSQNGDFDMSLLTGLKYIDNGTTVNCDGKSIPIDNNKYANYYSVHLDSKFFPDLQSEHLNFNYGNDIDNSALIETEKKIEILATATASPPECKDLAARPVVVRYPK